MEGNEAGQGTGSRAGVTRVPQAAGSRAAGAKGKGVGWGHKVHQGAGRSAGGARGQGRGPRWFQGAGSRAGVKRGCMLPRVGAMSPCGHCLMVPMLLSLLLPGACAQAWGVTLPKGPLWVQQGSCVTLSCSYTLPVGEQLQAVVWYWGQHQGQSKTIYDSSTKEWMMFNGRAEFLGHLGHNCSLRLGNLQLGDGGFYHVKLTTQKRTWSSPRRLRLTVTGTVLLGPHTYELAVPRGSSPH